MTTTRRRSAGSPAGVARKEVIIRAAAKVFAENGFSAATVRDVADEADMLSGSLYYYFDSKESIVEQVLVEYLDMQIRAYERAVEATERPVERLEQLVAEALRGTVTHREHLTILQNDWQYVGPMQGILERQAQIEKIWLRTIQEGIDSGALRADIDPRMIYRTVMGAIQAVIRWFDPRGRVSIDHIIFIQKAILLDGVRAPS
ncbi:TetR/AcrR family transcriptional regulator [Microbacterium rhizomatis]|uniref:TetR/AcrR family transcriptional regulator n=1 Tax=Microbacterium rhizomatis TaxID=1631477 RepID=UPI0014791AC8|nr:TetR/AcrR family transcriptional regulator [Microbacterium rhizomatis]